MTMRSRLTAVLIIVAGGVLSLIASTQPWFEVLLVSGENDVLSVAGAAALPVLAPLSLAALALGLALTVVGPLLRYLFGALAIALGVVVAVGALQLGWGDAVPAVASTVTEATGLAGTESVRRLIADISATAWPVLTGVGGALIVAGGVLTLLGARRWGSAGRRYQSAGTGRADGASRPHDAIDSWDDLSHGDDPTER